VSFFLVLGDPEEANLGRPLDYYEKRGVLLDCRGGLQIHKSARVGFRAKIITQSHISELSQEIVDRPVTIGKRAFIGSFSILYNCTIGENAVVSIGSVVASVDVPPNVMVEGNPAQVIATKLANTTDWHYLQKPRPLRRRGT
jgi:serine acetyltransferase